MELRYALFALLVFGMAFAGISISDYTLTPSVIEPGASGVLEITIANTGTTDAVESVSVTVGSATALGIDRTFAVGDVEASSSVVVSVPFTAEDTIPSGYYTVSVRAIGRTAEYYLGSDGTLKSSKETFEKTATLPVQVVEEPVISISLSEESVEDLTQEVFTFTNDGGKAQKLKVTILNSGIGFLNADQLYVAELGESESVAATLDARGATEGATKLRIYLEYQNELGTQMNETKEIPITVKKAEGNFVFVQQAPIVTGEDESLKLTFTNEGNAVSDLRFTFSNESVRFRGLNEFKVGSVGAGEVKSLEVPLVAELQPGTQNVVLSLKWVEAGKDRTGTITVPLEVVLDARVGVFLEAKPAPLQAGGEHTISVTVSNLGSYDIEGTTVEFASDALTLLTIQPQQYIGGLESDDFSSVQYKVRVGCVEPGTYPATVNVTFRDASSKWVTVETEANIAVVSPPQEEGSAIPLLFGLLIIGGALYWWFKKRKKA
ncbi:LPXTG cell wall anchor domain-containing protein [Candidatus Micrarchaeota archaeon]|nr:LPXTG cell wall anchor domain-containing protein [Candidatus Micrarchaeota archaeon]